MTNKNIVNNTNDNILDLFSEIIFARMDSVKEKEDLEDSGTLRESYFKGLIDGLATASTVLSFLEKGWSKERILNAIELRTDKDLLKKNNNEIKSGKTDKFNNMISAFQCDFSLAVEGKHDLSELNTSIKNKQNCIIKDIELLEELEFLLRYGRAEIHMVDKKK